VYPAAIAASAAGFKSRAIVIIARAMLDCFIVSFSWVFDAIDFLHPYYITPILQLQ
jgi:hypothetical protein